MKPFEKRFTDIRKWDREWFLSLTSDEKVVWQFMLDNCDRSGFWAENWTLVTMLTRIKVTSMPKTFIKQVQKTNSDGVWFIKDFPSFQYGEEFATKQGYLQKKCVERMKSYGVGIKTPPATPPNTPQAGEGDSPIDIDIDINIDMDIVEKDKGIVEVVSDFCLYQSQKNPHHYKDMEKQIETGYDVVDKLMRLDGYKMEDIKESLEWAVADDFWSPNIVTLTGLRKKSTNGSTKFQNMLGKFKATDTKSKMRDFING